MAFPDGHPVPALRFGGYNLCDNALVKGETYFAVVANDDSTAYRRLEAPFGPQDHPPDSLRTTEYESQMGIVCPFRRTSGICQNSPEAILVHVDCLRLLMRLVPRKP